MEYLWKLPCKRKMNLLMEKTKRVKKESDRKWGKTRANGRQQ